MDRRSFFRTMVGGIAAGAAVRTWPFRVYSFPADLAMPLPAFTEKYISGVQILNEYRAGIIGEGVGFDWYIEEEVPVTLVSTRLAAAQALANLNATIDKWNAKPLLTDCTLG